MWWSDAVVGIFFACLCVVQKRIFFVCDCVEEARSLDCGATMGRRKSSGNNDDDNGLFVGGGGGVGEWRRGEMCVAWWAVMMGRTVQSFLLVTFVERGAHKIR